MTLNVVTSGRDGRLALVGLNGAAAVIASAAAAHGWGLRGAAELMETAARLHLVHCAVLLALALWLRQAPSRWGSAAFWLIQIGCLCFGGALYYGALTGLRPLALIAPTGGMALIAGWLCLTAAGLSAKR